MASSNVNTIDDPDLKLSLTDQALASCTGAFITAVLVAPFDVVKTRLQAQKSALAGKQTLKFEGTIDALQKIARHEGVTRLWSGLPMSLLLALPTTVIYFCTSEQLRVFLRSKNGIERVADQPLWISVVAIAGARICTDTAVSPLELVRTNIQSANMSYRELLKSLHTSVKTNGYKVLWRGVLATLYRNITFSTCYWLNYQNLKIMFDQQVPTSSFSFVAGAISGAISTMVTIPFDVVKTNQQVDFQGKSGRAPCALAIATKIYASYGMRGLFTGVVPRLWRIVPSCGITITIIEYAKTVLRNKTVRKNEKIAMKKFAEEEFSCISKR